VLTADFNRDGNQDVAVANTTGSVKVMLGTGTGTFGSATGFDVGSIPVSICSGDFNFDGNIDLATANEGVATVSILLALATEPSSHRRRSRSEAHMHPS